jgi:hypothetical protein
MVATLAPRKDTRLARKLPYTARVTTVVPAADTPLTPEKDVKAMLRDIALVLHLTKKVKAEILADRAAEVATAEVATVG